jgi:AbrB family looped-hinge helix DNA binding protein
MIADEIKFKTVKMSTKGQITIPTEMQKDLKIKKGDEIILVKKGKKILLEKSENIIKKMGDEFDDMQYFSEKSLKKIWLNKNDDIWDQYLK